LKKSEQPINQDKETLQFLMNENFKINKQNSTEKFFKPKGNQFKTGSRERLLIVHEPRRQKPHLSSLRQV